MLLWDDRCGRHEILGKYQYVVQRWEVIQILQDSSGFLLLW